MRDDGGISGSLLNMTKRALRSRQKTLAGACELNTPTASLEDGDAEMALKIANAAADRRFLDAQGHAGLAEAAMFDRRHEIAQMPQFDRFSRHYAKVPFLVPHPAASRQRDGKRAGGPPPQLRGLLGPEWGRRADAD